VQVVDDQQIDRAGHLCFAGVAGVVLDGVGQARRIYRTPADRSRAARSCRSTGRWKGVVSQGQRGDAAPAGGRAS
jgi:hypothetical protein